MIFYVNCMTDLCIQDKVIFESDKNLDIYRVLWKYKKAYPHISLQVTLLLALLSD